MKILVTGANGLLGSSLVAEAQSRHIAVKGLDRALIDFSDMQTSINNFGLRDIDVLIHCAANTNVEYCEQYPVTSYQDNVLLTEFLVNACACTNTKFVLISSTGVYGAKGPDPFCEYDQAVPTTVHHSCKLAAEEIVLKCAPKPLVVRTGWLFGGSIKNPKNFVVNRIKEARDSNVGVMKSDISQIGNPTFVGDLASHIFTLFLDDRIGLYNCVNEGRATRFEYVSAIIQASKLPIKVEPVSADSFNRLAKVSFNESALNYKLTLFGLNNMPPWQSSLIKYVEQISGGI